MIGSSLLIKLAVVAGLLAGAAWTGHTWTDRKWSSKWDKAVAAQQTALALEQAKNRQIEQDWNVRLQTAEARHATDLQTVQNARRRADAESRSLRDALAAIGGRPAAEDSLAACRERTATLGELFAEADAEAGRMAEAAEQHAAQVRLLLAAWPRQETAEVY